MSTIENPLWMLAEISYKCPLQCPYCSNPVDYTSLKGELSTAKWIDVFRQGRELGVVQLGFSGGEPLVRQDLEELISEAHQMGYYTNLITSSLGMDEARLKNLKQAGLEHIQISFQASDAELNDKLAGTKSFDHKIAMAKLVKQYDFQFVFNVVIHRYNIDEIESILQLAMDLDADQVELANTQYYGFAFTNRSLLLPSQAQLEASEKVVAAFRERYPNKKIYYVVPDYYANRPKPCMGGWGKVFITITANGLALPCHSARVIPDLTFPNILEMPLINIWYDSPAFNHFRGYDWMIDPCKTCPEREIDFGGCHCQAQLLTGNAAAADPVCDLSPNHHIVLEALANREADIESLTYRNPKNSKLLSIPVSVEKKDKS